jgi:endogenous inhibitor of DNA gyrase (YacG/DUF329 family)
MVDNLKILDRCPTCGADIGYTEDDTEVRYDCSNCQTVNVFKKVLDKV